MVKRIKENPKLLLTLVSLGILLISLLFMFAKGFNISTNSGYSTMNIYSSFFALVFGGKSYLVSKHGSVVITDEDNIILNPLLLVSFILIVTAILTLLILIFSVNKKKPNNTMNIVLTVTVIILLLTSAVLILVSRRSSVACYAKGVNPEATEEFIKKYVENNLENTRLGAGSILVTIMSFLSIGSILGVTFISIKDNK